MEKEKLYDKWTATGLETIKACVEDKIANYCELNKKQCQEVLNFIEKQQKEIKARLEEITSYAYTSAEERDCQDYAIQVLKELLGE